MINFTQNGDSAFYHLVDFQRCYEHEKGKDASVTPEMVARKYIENQMSMEKGMDDYYNYLEEIDRKNKRLLKAIKSVKGKTYYKYLLEIIKSCENITDQIEIVSNPTGEYQKENYGRTIKGIWLEQWSTGTEGDSFEGIVCVYIRPKKYLRFRYSM